MVLRGGQPHNVPRLRPEARNTPRGVALASAGTTATGTHTATTTRTTGYRRQKKHGMNKHEDPRPLAEVISKNFAKALLTAFENEDDSPMTREQLVAWLHDEADTQSLALIVVEALNATYEQEKVLTAHECEA